MQSGFYFYPELHSVEPNAFSTSVFPCWFTDSNYFDISAVIINNYILGGIDSICVFSSSQFYSHSLLYSSSFHFTDI
jgi:hypothetical protein